MHNGLSEIPDTLGKLLHLECLLLSHNHLRALPCTLERLALLHVAAFFLFSFFFHFF